MREPFRVSVCIATRNRSTLLASLLENLERTAARMPLEVVVADNGSTDETARLLAGYKGLAHHRHVHIERPGKSRALNAAIAAARGRLLAFLDDDETPTDTWPDSLVGFLDERPEYAAAIGRVLPPPDADPELVRRAREWRTLTFFDEGNDVRDTDTLVGGNMMLRREVFDAIGPFNEALGPGAAGGAEDHELSRRIVSAGMPIGYVPDAVVYHGIDPERLTARFLREYKLRSARSKFATDPRWACWKAVRHLLADLPGYPIRAALGPPALRRTKARIVESFEVLRLGLGGRVPPVRREQRATRLALVNINTGWGGGEIWFAQTAAALAARGRPLLLVAAEHSRLHGCFERTGQPTVCPRELREALERHDPTVVMCNARKDLHAVRRAMVHATRLVLFRGIASPLNDNFVRRRSWRALSHIIVNSESTRGIVERSLPWFPRDRMTRIYHQVPFRPETPVPSRDGDFRIGSVSRLVRSKAVDHLIAAVALLPLDLRWSLVIAGDGKCRPRLEAQVAAAGLTERCRFLGHCRDVAPVYAQLDVVAIPSLREGFCFTAVEAALAGVPVVATDATALREVVLDERTGLLVPPEDPAAIAAALLRLARDREWAGQLGRAAQLVARERFQGPALIDQLEQCLDRVATEEPVGRG